MRSPAAVRAHDVWFTYGSPPSAGWVLRGISLEVPQGCFWAILGPSGAGKTTLVKILAGLLTPHRGEVEVLGLPIEQGRIPQHLRQKIGYIPQQLGLVRGLTALENVLLGSLGRNTGLLPVLGLFPKADVKRAMEYLELLGIAHKAHEKVFRLSGGERQRVAIARTLLQGPKVIFADEFVSDLDLLRAGQIIETMRHFVKRDGITFLLNLHEIQLVQEFADEFLILKEGTIVYQGEARSLTMSLFQEVLEYHGESSPSCAVGALGNRVDL
ncbi:MAG: ATP-binding cassette domain-containing protein [Armatimonadota bacterium]|nr:ATP-binding cassette domain-containing protein [Armatimonadota bacterium]